MKTKMYLMIVMMLCSVTISAQTKLDFSKGNPMITVGGKYLISESDWKSQSKFYVDCTSEVQFEIGFENWTEKNSWGAPAGAGLSQEQKQKQYVSVGQSGQWSNSYIYGLKTIFIRRITTRSTLTVGSTTKPITEWSGEIKVKKAENVLLKIEEFFASSNAITKDGEEVGGNKAQYVLTGKGKTQYVLYTLDNIENDLYELSLPLLNFSDEEGGGEEDTPPKITKDPSPLSLVEGEELLLSVEATGKNLTYQWHKDGKKVTGATSSVYKVTALPSHTGRYSCTVSNHKGSVTSKEVMVTVTPRPEEKCKIIVTSSPGGSISPSGEVVVSKGETLTFILSPQEGYEVEKVNLLGTDYLVEGNTFNTPPIQEGGLMVAYFKATLVGNEEIQDTGIEIYTSEGILMISSPLPIIGGVYNLQGQIITSFSGTETQIPLNRGIYIVRVPQKITKKILVK
ncbi:hypothetical protein M2480_001441 [Parabacteroides sp. PFB2-12]|uniref:immunoglobulin domain-containing protein n=1 Tax=unclassified Parabacteroides TaxID=2649774 RepID=UPI0024766FC6|nr:MULTISPECIES: immunoglobulin domain-containing protein [unclassified Parabacteroides]MDH6342904.1 hypothetical protein [Parabacteroides sp. PM6-13]MDH6390466.1 hypothetical protein [Parabacteroides sp. PFB2-12]